MGSTSWSSAGSSSGAWPRRAAGRTWPRATTRRVPRAPRWPVRHRRPRRRRRHGTGGHRVRGRRHPRAGGPQGGRPKPAARAGPRPLAKNVPPRRRVPRPRDATPRARPAPRQAAARPARPADPMPAPPRAPAGGEQRRSMWETRAPVQAEVPEREAPPPEPVAPPEPQLVELVVPADAVIGLQLETTVSSDRAKVEDAVEARVTRDVRVDGRVAIPAGSLVQGTVTEVVRGGKVRERARLSIRFHTVVIGNGDRLALRTDAITREGSLAGPRERDEDRRRRSGRRNPGRNPRRRQGRGDRRRSRRRWRHRGGHGRGSQHRHDSRGLDGQRARSSSPCRSPSRRSDRRHCGASHGPGAIPGRRTYGPAGPAASRGRAPAVRIDRQGDAHARWTFARSHARPGGPGPRPDQGDVSRRHQLHPRRRHRGLRRRRRGRRTRRTEEGRLQDR